METLRNLVEIAIYVAGSFCVAQEYHDIMHSKNKRLGSTTRVNATVSINLFIYDNFSLNCVQPTNNIELGELVFPLQSKVFFTVITSNW